MFEFFDAIIELYSGTLELLLLVPKAIAYFGGFSNYILVFADFISPSFHSYIAGLTAISLTLGLFIGIFK